MQAHGLSKMVHRMYRPANAYMDGQRLCFWAWTAQRDK